MVPRVWLKRSSCHLPFDRNLAIDQAWSIYCCGASPRTVPTATDLSRVSQTEAKNQAESGAPQQHGLFSSGATISRCRCAAREPRRLQSRILVAGDRLDGVVFVRCLRFLAIAGSSSGFAVWLVGWVGI